MIKVYIGISGSGKTTLCKKEIENDKNSVRINRDDLRYAIYGLTDETYKHYFLREDFYQCEQFISDIENRIITKAINKGKNIYADNTHLKQKYIKKYYEYKVPVFLEWVDCDLELAKQRDSNRDRNVGSKVIEKQYNSYKILKKNWSEPYFHYEQINQVHNNEPCYIFDIDGTLAKMNGRSPYDYSRVSEDLVNEPIAELCRELWRNNHNIIICTGRDGVCEEETRQWLLDNEIFFDALYIRKSGDSRADYIVKEEMWRDICKYYYIDLMFDDRNQVVDHARSLGFSVCQVDYGDF